MGKLRATPHSHDARLMSEEDWLRLQTRARTQRLQPTDRSKHRPHQGTQEAARRLRRGW